jgi:carbonic anhydrase
MTNVLSADEALQRLVEGNRRFLEGKSRNAVFCPETLAKLADGQKPFATILGCSDSRVAPEIVFDAGLGELFIIRVAGNVVSPEIIGSLQYAAMHLETLLFVVLGHEGCGAVHAALDQIQHGTDQPSRVAALLRGITPGLAGLGPMDDADEGMRRAVEANVRWSMRQVRETPEGKQRAAEGRLKLVGAVYEIATGRVRWLEA